MFFLLKLKFARLFVNGGDGGPEQQGQQGAGTEWMVWVKRHHAAAEAKCIVLRARRLLDPRDGSSQSSIVWL